jgi:nitrous oxidase accessory protein
MRLPGSARALACRFRRHRRNYLCEVRKDRACSKKVRDREGAIASIRAARAPQIVAIALVFACNINAGTLQEQIEAAAPGDTIRVKAGVHAERIRIDKPITLVGEPGAEIRGNGVGKVIVIDADDVTIRDLHITGSGLELSDDDAAVFVTGNRATIENCTIANSLHGVYLKKISGAQILNNRIQGKTTLGDSGNGGLGSRPSANLTAGKASMLEIEKGIGQSAENCDSTLVANRRGNGIHQWNCEGNVIRGNEISNTRDGIYFSFTNHSRVENNVIRHARYGLHYMYSDANTFENNTFAQNAAGAAIMFSKDLVIRGNHFVNNRGHRAYGLIFQSSDRSRLEQNEISENAVGLSFNQSNANQVISNRVSHNYIGLRFGSNSDGNTFTENVFTKNLHPVETGGSDVSGSRWAANGVGNRWDDSVEIDLNGDGINDLPHRELSGAGSSM